MGKSERIERLLETLNCLVVIELQEGEGHRERHQELHRALDELLTDFMSHTGRLPSATTIKELMDWSHEQTQNPI